MNLKKLKPFFTKNLLIITVIFPLIIILFYGISISFALKYKHKQYTQRELKRYEHELKNKHRIFLKEKAKYIESFMDIIYEQELKKSDSLSLENILKFIDSIKKYDSGFIFIFREDGRVIKHPCAERLINLVQKNRRETILSTLIKASEDKNLIHYQGTNCIDNDFINKIGIVYHIKTTNLYIVISKNEKDIIYSIEQKKRVWADKLNDELRENIKLLFILSIISIVFSIIFSKIINNLIKGYEKEIKDSNKVMFSQSRLAQAGELLSMISHQWRQPISKIASIASNMRFKMMIGELDAKYIDKKLEEIEEHTEFLSETIDDFREFYKPQKSKELEYILPLVDRSLGFLEGQIKKKSIIIQKEFATDVKVSIYPNEFIQVIINIVQNAIDFSKNGATIEMKTKIKDDEYIIMIKDEAGGISDKCIDKIFDAHFSTKTSKESTNLGLGLYVSKVIIENHFNSKLEVRSRDKSSTFTIRLVR